MTEHREGTTAVVTIETDEGPLTLPAVWSRGQWIGAFWTGHDWQRAPVEPVSVVPLDQIDPQRSTTMINKKRLITDISYWDGCRDAIHDETGAPITTVFTVPRPEPEIPGIIGVDVADRFDRLGALFVEWGLGDAFLSRSEVIRLRNHLTWVLERDRDGA